MHEVRRPELNLDADDPDWMEVTMDDGEVYRAEIAFPSGSPQNPFAESEILDKFCHNLDSVHASAPQTAAGASSEDNRADASRLKTLVGWADSDDVNAILMEFGRSDNG